MGVYMSNLNKSMNQFFVYEIKAEIRTRIKCHCQRYFLNGDKVVFLKVLELWNWKTLSFSGSHIKE